MSSGNKAVKINNLERAVSTDINRMQAFQAFTLSELARFSQDGVASDLVSGGSETMGPTTLDNPMRGLIMQGIRPRPEIATVNLFIEPGVGYIMSPDAMPNTDDSPWKLVVDPGVQLAGQLTLTANASGMTRFDMIECQRDPDKTLEVDNRDVFNPASGLFTATSLTKVTADRLKYRIRLGAPGGGFAGLGTAAGWLPLAVARVPNGAADWNACDLWDVRPLMDDRLRPPFQEPQVYQLFGKRLASVTPTMAQRNAVGIIEASFASFRAGGVLVLPGLTALDLMSAEILEGGAMLVGPGFWYFYAMFPFGLPRWARYTPAGAGQRIPMGFRGLPVLTQKAPNTLVGAPSAAITMPTGLGLGGTSTLAALLMAGTVDAGNSLQSLQMSEGWMQAPLVGGATNFNIGAVDAQTQDFIITQGVHVPFGATAARIRLSVSLTDMAGTGFRWQNTISVRDPANTVDMWVKREQSTRTVPAGGGWVEEVDVEIPLMFGASGLAMSATRVRFHVGTDVPAMISFNPSAAYGWKFGA